jgi:hypothetical protein
MTKEILERAWNVGRTIKVRYKKYDMDWVTLPKQQDFGMSEYKTLKWDIDTYEYIIKDNQ